MSIRCTDVSQALIFLVKTAKNAFRIEHWEDLDTLTKGEIRVYF